MSIVYVCAGLTVTKSVMLSFWLTLAAEVKPLICPIASVAISGPGSHPEEPVCWFSRTIGLSRAAGVEAWVGTAVRRREVPRRAATAIRRNRMLKTHDHAATCGWELVRIEKSC